ncbi:MAG: type II toxin-antitoxin system VapC family toxin [Candidatus Dormiibacterota bacterium]
MRIYLDSSALVKLVQREAESDRLRAFLRRHRSEQLVTSALARVEVVRAVVAGGPAAVEQARRQLSRLDQVVLSNDLLDAAATLAPAGQLRSLDAIHLAAAQLVGSDLSALVTYDGRMADAARALGLKVEKPGDMVASG